MQRLSKLQPGESTAITTTAEAMLLFAEGDKVFRTNSATGPASWHFVNAMCEVTAAVIERLQVGRCPVRGRLGGRLVPLGDGLFPGTDNQAQTWGWKRLRSFRLNEQELLAQIAGGDAYWSRVAADGRTWDEKMRRRLALQGRLVKVGAKYVTNPG